MTEQLEKNPEQVYEDRKAVKKIGTIEERVNHWYL